MIQKFIVDPSNIEGLQKEVDKNLWSAYRKQNSDYINCLIGFHKMSLKDRMKIFGLKSTEPVKTSHLTELHCEEEIFVDECGGTKESGLHYAGDLFTGYLSTNLKDWNLINTQPKTEKSEMKVFEMHKDGDYRTIFGSFNKDLEALCMTQAQIKNFCEKNKDKLRTNGYATFFLFKEGESFFVADVRFDDDGCLKLYVDGFDYIDVWCASNQSRVVVPATALVHSVI
ncbi:MAG: hypothetical protein NTX85_04100 [Candidatus Nomurabacteria bacterium]|nr:hypothetical protein [Candidatus Nomurabacteria bacterium]